MSNFTNSADSRETSVEIMTAIEKISASHADAVRIWEEPTREEVLAVREDVTNDGLLDAAAFCWGAAGENWANGWGVVDK